MDLPPSSFLLPPLLSQLWLHEPDAETVARAVNELGLPPADPAELASAYADVFLLNVPPYGTVFTDPEGEMNGAEAQHVRVLFEARGYCPPELTSVGAPDHVGLCLGFLNAIGLESGELSLDWIAVCCFAVEREPSAHGFYRTLANRTRAMLLGHPETIKPKPQSPIFNLPLPIAHSPGQEVSLRDLIRFFLAPARCGLFLSRSRLGRMANALELRLPFGSRFDVAERLFAAAGETGQVARLMDTLAAEIGEWRLAYRQWGEKHPAWRSSLEVWLGRTEQARRVLARMREVASDPEGHGAQPA